MRLQFSAFIQTCVVITFGKVRNTAGHEPSNINIPGVSLLYELAYLQNHNNTPLGVLFMNKGVSVSQQICKIFSCSDKQLES